MFGILGLIVIIVFTIYAYKSAKDTGRNALLWALGVFGVGFGLQIVLPVIIVMVIGVVMVASGTPVNELQYRIESFANIIGIALLLLSFVGMGLMMKVLSKVPETDDGRLEVPPPPQFGNFE